MSGSVNPQAAFEQSVKALGEWLVFLKSRESEYRLQMERARKATPTETSGQVMEVPVVEIEQEEMGSDVLPPMDAADMEKHEAWL
jgi:hypothetical protein